MMSKQLVAGYSLKKVAWCLASHEVREVWLIKGQNWKFYCHFKIIFGLPGRAQAWRTAPIQ
jgi:hypothetical protein